MAAKFFSHNSINRCAVAAGCTSVRILPVIDAAVILVVSVLVCLRVIMPLV